MDIERGAESKKTLSSLSPRLYIFIYKHVHAHVEYVQGNEMKKKY